MYIYIMNIKINISIYKINKKLEGTNAEEKLQGFNFLPEKCKYSYPA